MKAHTKTESQEKNWVERPDYARGDGGADAHGDRETQVHA